MSTPAGGSERAVGAEGAAAGAGGAGGAGVSGVSSDVGEVGDTREVAGVPATVEQAPPEVEQYPAGARAPARSEFARFPTGPVGVGPIVTSGPNTGPTPQWEPASSESQPDEPEPKLAPWALLAASVALVASFFVGWGIPVAIVSVVAAIMCLRRPTESRSIARWALVLGIIATVYSTGWLIWAASQFDPNAAGALG